MLSAKIAQLENENLSSMNNIKSLEAALQATTQRLDEERNKHVEELSLE